MSDAIVTKPSFWDEYRRVGGFFLLVTGQNRWR